LIRPDPIERAPAWRGLFLNQIRVGSTGLGHVGGNDAAVDHRLHTLPHAGEQALAAGTVDERRLPFLEHLGRSRGERTRRRSGRFRLGTWPAQLHPELQEFLDYWLAKHGPRGELPSRAQIDPSEIPTILTGIALCDVERVNTSLGYRFKYRLLGTRHSVVNPSDFSGRYVEDVHYPDEAVPIIGAFCLVVERKLPHYWRRERVSRRDPSVRTPYERIIVPLASDGVTVDMLLGHFVFYDTGDSWH